MTTRYFELVALAMEVAVRFRVTLPNKVLLV